MKYFISRIIFIIFFFVIFIGLLVMGAKSESIMDILRMFGSLMLASLITGGMACFACWLAQPDESKSDKSAVSEAISEDRIYEDDEIVRQNTYFHMERMDEGHIWFSIGELKFDLYANKRGKLTWIPQTSDGSWDAIRDEEKNE